MQEKHAVLALRALLIIGGIVIGIRHGMEAVELIAESKGGLPLSAWIFVAGPLSTFPASLTAVINPKVGAVWLTAAAAVSIVPVLYERLTGGGPFVLLVAEYGLPLIGLAALAWLLTRWRAT
jgi:hypothetical protein